MKKLLTILLFYQLLFISCSTKPLVSDSKKAAHTVVAPEEAYFTNPIAEGADPWVIRKDSFYYTCGAVDKGIFVSRSLKLTEPGERVVVWETPAKGWNQSNVWAPELHFFNGKWYIYYAAASKPGGPFIHQRSGVLESEGQDPFGPYIDKGMLYTGDNIANPASVKWAIDLTPLQLNGQLYALWSGWEENRETDKTKQHLYIAKMSNPWTIGSNRIKLSSPVESWETGGELDLIEGPQVLKHKEKLFIIYSTRESWLKDYRLGQLTMADTLLDPMEPSSWSKKGPVFQGTERVYGVGHCSFAKSPDGTEDWILYHAKKLVTPGWLRDIRLQPFTWHQDGTPDFGVPVPAGVPLRVPSGEEVLVPVTDE